MKKLAAILTLLFFLFVSTCACSANDETGTNSDSYESEVNVPATDSAGYVDKVEKTALADYSAPLSNETRAQETAAPEDAVKKVIRNAKIDMEAKDVKDTYADILAFALKNGGYEFSQQTTVNGEYTTLRAEIKIPANKLDELTAFIDDCGKVINCNVSANDITDQYYDAEIRLKTQKTSLEQYYRMLREAENIDEILQVQGIIDDMTEEIEALEGKLRLWEKQVAESTVSLYVQQKDDPDKKIKRDIDWNALSISDMGTLMLNGIVGILNTIVSVLQWLLIAIVVASPLLILAGCFLLVILARRRKKKKEQ